jgi:DNA-binding MarR family transcriptional regulator
VADNAYFRALLATVSRAAKARGEQTLIAHGVHAGQEFLLERLWREEGLTPGELSRRLGIETPTVVKMVQRMEAAGLVERRPHPTDARLVQVYLTARGKALEQAVPVALDQVIDGMLAGFSVDERAQLEALLERVRQNLGADDRLMTGR